MKRILVGLSVVAALTLVPSTAAAAQPAAAARHPAAASAASAGQVERPDAIWEDFGWFYDIDDCINVGEYGRSVGTWYAYECSYQPKRNPSKPWLLRALYN